MSATTTPADVLRAYLDEDRRGPTMTQMNVYVPKDTKRLIEGAARRLSWSRGKVVVVAVEMLDAALDGVDGRSNGSIG